MKLSDYLSVYIQSEHPIRLCYPSKPLAQSSILFFDLAVRIRSLICVAALCVPARPAHPLAANQFTSFGVIAATTPILSGKNSVLCTEYARMTIAYSPSCPPCCTALSIPTSSGEGA